jgi:hypothetical protein
MTEMGVWTAPEKMRNWNLRTLQPNFGASAEMTMSSGWTVWLVAVASR